MFRSRLVRSGRGLQARTLAYLRSTVGTSSPSPSAKSAHSEARVPAAEGLGQVLVKNAPQGLSNMEDLEDSRFRLSRTFVEGFRDRKAPFGFNGFGEVVYHRTYSRPKPNGGNEEWFETVERVVNGTFRMQKRWITEQGLGWDSAFKQDTAQEMYERIFAMQFLPPGRGLWAMGSPMTEERQLYAALNNCAFVSTAWSPGEKASAPFRFLMDASMLGVGVGFDTEAANSGITVARVDGGAEEKIRISIADSREGWVNALALLIDTYLCPAGEYPHGRNVEFDFSAIRPSGSPIRGFGGVASGPKALEDLLEGVRATLGPLQGRALTATAVVDLMNRIGCCVIAGNVRRTAEIAFGPHDDSEYLDLKNHEVNPERQAFGWASNNSVYAPLGMDYREAVRRIRLNGEPGFAWLQNMREYGRMGDPRDHADARAMGGNPCLEQTLESYELCCLVETFPDHHADLADYKRTLQLAYEYAKTVTLGRTHWPESNRVMTRNRRVGCSMSGIAQFLGSRGLGELHNWCEEGYRTVRETDRALSEGFGIPESVKCTSIKPSGTVSLLAGATPGMHYPESRFYIRRMRIPSNSPMLAPLREAGYPVEDAVGQADTSVVEFCVDAGEGVRTVSDVSMWEQFSLAAFLQRHWADNQVSCTVTFDPKTEGPQIHNALEYFQYQLKGISLLPRPEKGAYAQMPYEAITEDEYEKRLKAIKVGGRKALFHRTQVVPSERTPDRFCDTDTCSVAG